MHIFNTLAPVFLIIVLGSVLRKSRFLSAELYEGVNRLVYWVGLPCLLFYKIATAEYNFHTAADTFLVVVGGMAGCILLSYLSSVILHIPKAAVGTFVQGSFRGNLMYIGLPIVIYGFAHEADFESYENIAVLVLAFMVPVYNITAVVVLLASQHKIDRYIAAKVFRPLITNPFFIASIAGILYSFLLPGLPLAADRTLNAIGQIALPLALLAIGGTLVEGGVVVQPMFSFAASMIKVAAAPAIGFLFAVMLGLTDSQMRIAMIYLACPTAVISYVMADQLGGDGRLAAAIVFLSTILSIVSLAAVVALF